jgi:hypothetical protein
MIRYFDLMFASEENRNAWNGMEEADDTILKDMNLLLLIKELLGLDEGFPTRYIRYPCLSQSDADYRLDIMQELLLDSNLTNLITGLIKPVTEIERKFKQMHETEFQTQKEYIFLNTFIHYIEIINNCAGIADICKSPGLTAFSWYCREVIGQYSLDSLHKDLLALMQKLHKILKVSISISRTNKMVYVNNIIEENDTAYLEKSCSDLFDLKLESLFSIFNDAAYTPLEMRILDIRKSGNTAIFDELDNFFNKHIAMEKHIYDLIDLKEQIIFYITYIKLFTRLKSSGVPIT